MREKEIEEKFREAVKRAGGKAYKFVSPGNDGVPDRLVVMPGGHNRLCGGKGTREEAHAPAACAYAGTAQSGLLRAGIEQSGGD